MTWILDIETNGLWPEVTKIHCAVLRHVETNQVVQFVPDDYPFPEEIITPSGVPTITSLKWLPSHLERYCSDEVLSCHNGIGFDLKVLKKHSNYEHKGRPYEDTLLMSRILWPDIEMVPGIKGPHSIDAWGHRFGVEKPKHDDWSQFSEEMLHRCVEDTKIQAELYRRIKKYVDDMNMKDKRFDFSQVFRLEHKVWSLIEEQADNGWQFDLQKAYECVSELEDIIKNIDKELLPQLPIRVVRPNEVITKAFTSKGEITAIAARWFVQSGNLGDLMGDFSKVIFEPMNLNSDTQLKEYLLANGWNPKEYNFKKDKFNKAVKNKYGKPEKTSPKLPKSVEDWEEVAKLLDIPSISLLAERSKASHRLSQIKGLVDAVRQDHRIEARANTCGTNTRRMKHSIIVNIPKAKDSVYYGKQMRSLFIASPGRVLVGCDAHALEARIEAHYIYPFDKDSALELIEGDIHTRNAEIFNCSRDLAKNGKYAIGYGCAAPKLAATINCSTKQAEALIEKYWDGNPGLKKLKVLLEEAWQSRGYILSIDGAPLKVRYKHALINTLFQSAGSVVMKVALCILNSKIKNKRLDAKFIGNFHDEIQMDVLPAHAEQVAIIARQSIIEAGKYFKLNIPLEAESKTGRSWDEVH